MGPYSNHMYTRCIQFLAQQKSNIKMLSLFPTLTIVEESLQVNPKDLLYNNYFFLWWIEYTIQFLHFDHTIYIQVYVLAYSFGLLVSMRAKAASICWIPPLIYLVWLVLNHLIIIINVYDINNNITNYILITIWSL